MASSDYLDCELYLTDCDQARLWVADGDYSDRPALDEALERRLLLAGPDPIEYGTQLFAALFPGQGNALLAGYRTGLVIARRERKRLRFRLHIAHSAPAKLHDLHWERLYDPVERIALACSRDIAFSRYLSVASRPETTVAVRPKLLVVLSCPRDLAEYALPEISRERARRSILKALSPLGTRVSWELFEGAVTVGSIRDRLVAGGFHALHLHAHGVLDPERAIANLVLEDEHRRAAFVDEGLFSQLFEGERDLHLVTLIACHGGIQTGAEPFSGLAPALVRRGIPAVVAMRRAISFEGSARFAEHFYLNLARTGRIDTAANEARLQMYLAAPNGLEWSTPALSMRLTEGRLWQPAPARLDAERTQGPGPRGWRRRWRGLVAAAIAGLALLPISYLVSRRGEPSRVNAPGGLALPSDPKAARLCSEGLDKLRSFDAMSALGLLEAAVAADPEHPLPRAALAMALSELGYDGKAEQASEQALARSRGLPEHEQLAITAHHYEMTDEWDKAIETYGSLVRSFPEDVHCGIRLAEAQIRGGRSRHALVTLEKIRRLEGPGSDTPRIDLVRALAHLRLGEFQDAMASAERAARIGKERGWGLLVARARLREAAALWEQGAYSRAIPALDEAGTRFGAAGDRRGLAQTLEAKALAVRAQGDLDGARDLLRRALTTYREIGDRRSEANALVTLGNVFIDEGNSAAAEKHYHEALAVCGELHPRSLTTARVLLNIGVKFHTQGELAVALEKYQEAQLRFAELGDLIDSARTQTNIAEVHYLRGDLDRAQEMHENALAIRREIGDRDGEAYDTFRLGKVFAAKGRLFVARDKYVEALAARNRMGQTIAAEGIRAELANLTLLQGQTDEAERLARQAEEVLRAEGVLNLTALAQAVLARVLLVQDRLPEAQELIRRAQALAEVSEDRTARLSTAIVAARVRAAAGAAREITAAIDELEAVAVEASGMDFVGYAFEARLAVGEIEAASGRTAAAAVRLKALAKEASDRGYGQIARRAEAALDPRKGA